MTTKQGLSIIHFESRADWEAWLEENHVTSNGLWIKFAKNSSGIESVFYEEARFRSSPLKLHAIPGTQSPILDVEERP